MANPSRLCTVVLASLSLVLLPILSHAEDNTGNRLPEQKPAFSTFQIPIAKRPNRKRPAHVIPTIIPAAPSLNVSSCLLVDYNSGEVLVSKNPRKRVSPASLTKLMTLYVIFGALQTGRLQLDDEVPVSKKAWRMKGSRMFIRVNTKVPVEELIHGIVVASGNDATVAMSEYLAGSEDAFVSLMNQQAKALGMNHSNFTDATGMPHPNHYTTAEDMAILTRALIQHFPEFYPYFKQKYFTYNHIKQPNRNRLLWRDPAVDGLKTGYTSSAGYCLISSSHKNNMRLISVVMGAPTASSRTDNSARLLTYGFRFFRTQKLFAANETIGKERVWMGENEFVDTGLAKDLYVTLPINRIKNFTTTTVIKESVKAPVQKGQVLGYLEGKLDGRVLIKKPLVALTDDPKGGIWTRFKDYVKLKFHNFMEKHTDDEKTVESALQDSTIESFHTTEQS